MTYTRKKLLPMSSPLMVLHASLARQLDGQITKVLILFPPLLMPFVMSGVCHCHMIMRSIISQSYSEKTFYLAIRSKLNNHLKDAYIHRLARLIYVARVNMPCYPMFRGLKAQNSSLIIRKHWSNIVMVMVRLTISIQERTEVH